MVLATAARTFGLVILGSIEFFLGECDQFIKWRVGQRRTYFCIIIRLQGVNVSLGDSREVLQVFCLLNGCQIIEFVILQCRSIHRHIKARHGLHLLGLLILIFFRRTRKPGFIHGGLSGVIISAVKIALVMQATQHIHCVMLGNQAIFPQTLGGIVN